MKRQKWSVGLGLVMGFEEMVAIDKAVGLGGNGVIHVKVNLEDHYFGIFCM